MSKKHFISLAEFIKSNPDKFGDKQIEALADWLRTQHPQFKRGRWIGYIRGENGPSGGKR